MLVPRKKPSASWTEGSVTSFTQNRAPAGSRLSTAQQLYASAINKQKSSSPDPEASHRPKSPPMSPPSIPFAPKHASSLSTSSRVVSFPDLSRGNAQQVGSTDLYNMTVVAQQGGATSSSRRANYNSGQPQLSSSPRSQSVQLSSSQDFPAQPSRASTLASMQLDDLNRHNRNVVITRSTRLGEAPIVAMTASPPSAEQKSHPDTLISPPLYASSGPPTSAHYTPVTFLPAPDSPPIYYHSGRNGQSLSVANNAPPTYHPALDQSHQQQYLTAQVTQNQPPMHSSSTMPSSGTSTTQTQMRSQVQPSQYQDPSQQMSS